MKNKTSFILVIFLMIMLAASTLVILFQNGLELKITNPFVKTEQTVSSEAILKQVRDISRLNTIEFIYKTVFPYDLISENTDFNALVDRYRKGEKLSFTEIETLSVYGLAEQAGINLLKNDNSFAVVTVRLKAGYDFSDSLQEDTVLIDEPNRSITIQLPPVQITEVIIEDADSSIYDYPDLEVSPEQWKTLTSILSRKIKTKAEERGILEAAGVRGRTYIEQLLLSAGFQQVLFR